MAPFELMRRKFHPFSGQERYAHFSPTLQRFPEYSAGATPFRWLMRERLDHLMEYTEVDVDERREPRLNYRTNWWHEGRNQESVLNEFANHIYPEDSLCFFYAKHVPFVEVNSRILVAVGRVKSIGSLTEYERSGNGLRGLVWERPVLHSIRPNQLDGFIMPYQEIHDRFSEDQTMDIESLTSRVSGEFWDEFSYGSELVSHDGAISALLSLDGALSQIDSELGITSNTQRQWLQDELVRLWKIRGPYPGMGAVLRAFGFSRGLFLAYRLQQLAGENGDPWPRLSEAFDNPSAILPAELCVDFRELSTTWFRLPEDRRQVLRLLSRFEITVEQARKLYDEAARHSNDWTSTDRELLENPYRVYEVSRLDPSGIPILTVDRGIFPEQMVREKHPIGEPTELESAIDPRRVRAFTIEALESAANSGHTLDFPENLAAEIRNKSIQPECPVTVDSLNGMVPDMKPEVFPVKNNGDIALQLGRYANLRSLIRRQIPGRVNGTRHSVSADWEELVARKFGTPTDALEKRAQAEKAAALAELAASRFSVLAGSAGTGKTSLIGILCREIQEESILWLAPTGKARVRMHELAEEVDASRQTVAQFLLRHGRYEPRSGRFLLSDRPKTSSFGTVIVDESSMLTEDMLGALLDALSGVNRIILVGDHAQLPPIGPGRPFFDIVSKLRPQDYESSFPRVAKGYAELTVERRQIGAMRDDLRLTRWFGPENPQPGDDDVFIPSEVKGSRIRFVPWANAEEFRMKLLEVIEEELQLSGLDDVGKFNSSLGATKHDRFDYFNRGEAVKEVEAWQIMSPLRGMSYGVEDINRQIHDTFRADFMKLASQWRNRRIPSAMGAEKIVYGDKVINLHNHSRDRIYPDDAEALRYLANGEIGIVVGQWKTQRMRRAPNTLRVEFASQKGYTYDFNKRDFREETDSALELAYALTVHKAQGSQFGLVILVLPGGHPILTRELMYTALTRHEDRIVIMHQGSISALKDISAPHASETARRRTNLFFDSRMVEVNIPSGNGRVFLEEGLIHRTSKGHLVRSKSELLIAEALVAAGVEYAYEQPLTLGGFTRYPDFTVENDISGRTIYWEHLGMLENANYKANWEKKRSWYLSNGVKAHSFESNDSDGEADKILVTTTDSSAQGLDMSKINYIVEVLCGGM